MILTGKTEELGEKTCPVILSTTNPIWTDPGKILGLCSDRPVT
jgi:hypothetical protein